jgi:hypothetical protein
MGNDRDIAYVAIGGAEEKLPIHFLLEIFKSEETVKV